MKKSKILKNLNIVKKIAKNGGFNPELEIGLFWYTRFCIKDVCTTGTGVLERIVGILITSCVSDYVSEEGVSSLIVNKRKRLLKLEKMVLPPGIEPNTKFVHDFKDIALPLFHYYVLKVKYILRKTHF